MFVLDTNSVIYYFKGQGNIAANLLSQSVQEIAIPAIVVFELEVGIAKSTEPAKRIQQLATLLDAITVLPFGLQEAREAAQIRATLEQLGTPIGRYDTLIAGTTLARRGTLVTHNVNEFSRVPDLQIVDWF
jgi:tRNA(fMet)-specific endonuclease VapC